MRRPPAHGAVRRRPDPARDAGDGAGTEIVSPARVAGHDPGPPPSAPPTPRVPMGVIGAVTWLRLADRG